MLLFVINQISGSERGPFDRTGRQRVPLGALPSGSSLRIEFLLNQDQGQIGPLCLEKRGDRIQNESVVASLCDSQEFEPRKVWSTSGTESIRRKYFSTITHLGESTLFSRMNDIRWTPRPSSKFRSTIIAEGLVYLFNRIHDERSMF